MPGSELKLKTRGGEELDAYLSQPEGDGPFPGILLITAIFGTDQEMIDIADGWADDGFIVLVPDVFWRVLPGPTADREVAFGRYEKFDPVQGMLDIEDYIGAISRAGPSATARSASSATASAGVMRTCRRPASASTPPRPITAPRSRSTWTRPPTSNAR